MFQPKVMYEKSINIHHTLRATNNCITLLTDFIICLFLQFSQFMQFIFHDYCYVIPVVQISSLL